MTSLMPDLLYSCMDLRNICCTTFHKLESLFFPQFLFFIIYYKDNYCLCNIIIRWDVASNSPHAENIEHTCTWISDDCVLKISTLSSLNDQDYLCVCLIVCFYKMAIRRQLLGQCGHHELTQAGSIVRPSPWTWLQKQ